MENTEIERKLVTEIKRVEFYKQQGYASRIAILNDTMLSLIGKKIDIEYNADNAKVITDTRKITDRF